jgi:hypothetical protein
VRRFNGYTDEEKPQHFGSAIKKKLQTKEKIIVIFKLIEMKDVVVKTGY